MTSEDSARIGLLAGQAFRPSTPIRERDIFAGRSMQVRQAVDAIMQPGQSVLIHGERGVGKTSLANVIDEFFPVGQPEPDLLPAHHLRQRRHLPVDLVEDPV